MIFRDVPRKPRAEYVIYVRVVANRKNANENYLATNTLAGAVESCPLSFFFTRVPRRVSSGYHVWPIEDDILRY